VAEWQRVKTNDCMCVCVCVCLNAVCEAWPGGSPSDIDFPVKSSSPRALSLCFPPLVAVAVTVVVAVAAATAV